jgi:hypothetical protein
MACVSTPVIACVSLLPALCPCFICVCLFALRCLRHISAHAHTHTQCVCVCVYVICVYILYTQTHTHTHTHTHIERVNIYRGLERASSAPRPSTLSSSLTLPSITEGREGKARSTARDGEAGGWRGGTRSRHHNRSVPVGRAENSVLSSSRADRPGGGGGVGGVGVWGGGAYDRFSAAFGGAGGAHAGGNGLYLGGREDSVGHTRSGSASSIAIKGGVGIGGL